MQQLILQQMYGCLQISVGMEHELTGISGTEEYQFCGYVFTRLIL